MNGPNRSARVIGYSFLGMKLFGIDLNRISPGAPLIALGLLVNTRVALHCWVSFGGGVTAWPPTRGYVIWP